MTQKILLPILWVVYKIGFAIGFVEGLFDAVFRSQKKHTL